ncbi:MAG: ATP-binding protein [Euryarchaeota archaeon]|nr:ATP-binding protein [Euryarchaeota archaeon]
MDPRVKGIELKLRDVKRIIPVVSGKGGVGKSLISTTMALVLAKSGYRVGLLDLDFYGASDHVILGLTPEALPEEEKGVLPPEVHGLRFMSIVYYTQNRPLPMRGSEVSNALVELMAITRWDSLDYLIIDMPPGLGEQLLDLLRYIPRGEFLVVSTPSPLSVHVADSLLAVLTEGKHRVLGLVENMGDGTATAKLAEKYGIRVLGSLPYEQELDACIGNVDALLATKFAEAMKKIVKTI